ncbi:MAG: hypothetical protein JW750_03090 [Anaerolineaceae bacterium]|nr:hypothetical protein [Anaerolineaceae bacterium]
MKSHFTRSILRCLSVVGLLFLLAACNFPNPLSLGEGERAQPTATPAVDFLDADSAAHSTETIVIREVSATGEAITRVNLWLPASLRKLEVRVNGQKIKGMLVEEVLTLDLGDLSAPEVKIEFIKEESPQAICELNVKDTLSPTGDCGW